MKRAQVRQQQMFVNSTCCYSSRFGGSDCYILGSSFVDLSGGRNQQAGLAWEDSDSLLCASKFAVIYAQDCPQQPSVEGRRT